MNYVPDGWALVKIEGTDPHYRIFGSWRGGFADGDSWRMNSGVTKVEEDEDFYYFSGFSGSVYQCHKKGYGRLGPYNQGVLENYCDKSVGTMSWLRTDELPEIMTIDWLIL